MVSSNFSWFGKELNLLLYVFQRQNIILKSYSQCLDINWPAYPHSNYWCVRNHCQPWKKEFSIFYSTQQGTLFLELENDWVDFLSHFIRCGERMQRAHWKIPIKPFEVRRKKSWPIADSTGSSARIFSPPLWVWTLWSKQRRGKANCLQRAKIFFVFC